MAFRLPSLAEARDYVMAVGQAVFPRRNFANLRSYHARRATFLAAAMTQLHFHIDSAQKDSMPDTASDDGPIDRWGGIVGVERKGATAARKAQALRVFGTAGTPIDAGEELVHQPSNQRYEITGASAIPGGADSVLVDVRAIDKGSATRLDAGQTLVFVATPSGLRSSARLDLAIDEDGYDAEGFGAYRARVLAQFSEPTAGGTQADYVEWMLEVEGVSNAYAYPNRNGRGTVDVVALHSGTGAARELNAGEQEEVLDYIRERAPAHIAAPGGPLRHLDVVDRPEIVRIKVYPTERAYQFDWTGGPLTVDGFDGSTRVLTFTTSRPSTMKAGHRIAFEGTGQDGREIVIEALGASPDAVILAVAPPSALAGGELAYSGGPLVKPIRDAILAHMNGETVYAGKNRTPRTQSQLDESGESVVGLEVLTEGIGPANPGGIYGPWLGDLLRSVLGQITIYKAGVRTYDVESPPTDVIAASPAFPFSGTIELISPERVLVIGDL